jgi:hypothetical protein
VTRTFKIVCLAIGVAGFAILAYFGMAIWVFIPLFPVAIIYLIAIAAARHRAIVRKPKEKPDSRKAA